MPEKDSRTLPLAGARLIEFSYDGYPKHSIVVLDTEGRPKLHREAGYERIDLELSGPMRLTSRGYDDANIILKLAPSEEQTIVVEEAVTDRYEGSADDWRKELECWRREKEAHLSLSRLRLRSLQQPAARCAPGDNTASPREESATADHKIRALPLAGKKLVKFHYRGYPKSAWVCVEAEGGHTFVMPLREGCFDLDLSGPATLVKIFGEGDIVVEVEIEALPEHPIVINEATLDYPGSDEEWRDDLDSYAHGREIGVWAVNLLRLQLIAQ